MIDFLSLWVKSSAKGSSHTFFSAEIKPYNGIETTFNQCLRGLLLCCWLNQQECILDLLLSVDGSQLNLRDEATEISFEEFSLGKG
jgi:hypothetical protein